MYHWPKANSVIHIFFCDLIWFINFTKSSLLHQSIFVHSSKMVFVRLLEMWIHHIADFGAILHSHQCQIIYTQLKSCARCFRRTLFLYFFFIRQISFFCSMFPLLLSSIAMDINFSCLNNLTHSHTRMEAMGDKIK